MAADYKKHGRNLRRTILIFEVCKVEKCVSKTMFFKWVTTY